MVNPDLAASIHISRVMFSTKIHATVKNYRPALSSRFCARSACKTSDFAVFQVMFARLMQCDVLIKILYNLLLLLSNLAL